MRSSINFFAQASSFSREDPSVGAGPGASVDLGVAVGLGVATGDDAEAGVAADGKSVGRSTAPVRPVVGSCIGGGSLASVSAGAASRAGLSSWGRVRRPELFA